MWLHFFPNSSRHLSQCLPGKCAPTYTYHTDTRYRELLLKKERILELLFPILQRPRCHYGERRQPVELESDIQQYSEEADRAHGCRRLPQAEVVVLCGGQEYHQGPLDHATEEEQEEKEGSVGKGNGRAVEVKLGE